MPSLSKRDVPDVFEKLRRALRATPLDKLRVTIGELLERLPTLIMLGGKHVDRRPRRLTAPRHAELVEASSLALSVSKRDVARCLRLAQTARCARRSSG
jgi:hypothetical protein